MAEKIEKVTLYKGLKLDVEAHDLEPNVTYYAMLREDSGSYIATEPVVADEEGNAFFTFPYELTCGLKGDTNYTIFVFDKDRNTMASHIKNCIKTIDTSLGVDKNVPNIG